MRPSPAAGCLKTPFQNYQKLVPFQTSYPLFFLYLWAKCDIIKA